MKSRLRRPRLISFMWSHFSMSYPVTLSFTVCEHDVTPAPQYRKLSSDGVSTCRDLGRALQTSLRIEL